MLFFLGRLPHIIKVRLSACCLKAALRTTSAPSRTCKKTRNLETYLDCTWNGGTPRNLKTISRIQLSPCSPWLSCLEFTTPVPLAGRKRDQDQGARGPGVQRHPVPAGALEPRHHQGHAGRVREVPRRPGLLHHQRATEFPVQGPDLQAQPAVRHLQEEGGPGVGSVL